MLRELEEKERGEAEIHVDRNRRCWIQYSRNPGTQSIEHSGGWASEGRELLPTWRVAGKGRDQGGRWWVWLRGNARTGTGCGVQANCPSQPLEEENASLSELDATEYLVRTHQGFCWCRISRREGEKAALLISFPRSSRRLTTFTLQVEMSMTEFSLWVFDLTVELKCRLNF